MRSDTFFINVTGSIDDIIDSSYMSDVINDNNHMAMIKPARPNLIEVVCRRYCMVPANRVKSPCHVTEDCVRSLGYFPDSSVNNFGVKCCCLEMETQK